MSEPNGQDVWRPGQDCQAVATAKALGQDVDRIHGAYLTPGGCPVTTSRCRSARRRSDPDVSHRAYRRIAATGSPWGTSAARTASTRPPESSTRRAISSTRP